ncbi:MAG: hypothetical protein ACYTG0_45630 [Planctomycetota bacterium]|jgi:hypothetical protein
MKNTYRVSWKISWRDTRVCVCGLSYQEAERLRQRYVNRRVRMENEAEYPNREGIEISKELLEVNLTKDQREALDVARRFSDINRQTIDSLRKLGLMDRPVTSGLTTAGIVLSEIVS